MRFYPKEVPVFPNEPNREQFQIIFNTARQGEGLQSLRSFQSGDVLFAFTGFILPNVTLYSLQLQKNLHIHDPYFMGKLLHSCDPNAEADVENLLIRALKPIESGTFITIDYENTEDYLFRPFECSCGSPQCRGVIRGRASIYGDE